MRFVTAVVSSGVLLAAFAGAARGGGETTVSGPADAKIETEGNAHFMVTRSHTFELTQFADKGSIVTALVEAEIRHRKHISEDIGTNGDETGTVTLTVHPVSSSGDFGKPLASRTLTGDEVEVEGSGGIKVTTWGCCVESNAETQVHTGSLKTMFIRSSDAPLVTCTRLGKPAVGRIAAVYKATTAADGDVLGADHDVVGLITWAGENAPIQRIKVRLKAAKPIDAVL